MFVLMTIKVVKYIVVVKVMRRRRMALTRSKCLVRAATVGVDIPEIQPAFSLSHPTLREAEVKELLYLYM